MKFYIVLAILGLFILLGVVTRISNMKRMRGHRPKINRDAIRSRLDTRQNTEKNGQA